MNLSVLESRILNSLPGEYHEVVKKEFARFESETNRMSENKSDIGQASLTDHEVERLTTTNQHGNKGLTVVQWQCVKAAAIHYGITDWTSKVDPHLTKEENITLMEEKATKNSGVSMKKLNKIK